MPRPLKFMQVLLVALSLSAPADGALAQAERPDTPAAYSAPEEAYIAIRPMIADMQRIVTPNGIEVTEAITLGGIAQWISIRGHDRANPILIYVHGGPGASEMGRSWVWRRGVEEYFTVVHWDQRGTGKTARANGVEETAPTLTRERMTEDLVELIDHLRGRLAQEHVVLLGHSWGNVIALDAALARPEAVAAYVALSPAMAMEENERVGYERLLAMADDRGDSAALAELQTLAPYPGEMTPERLAAQRVWVQRWGGLAAYRGDGEFFLKAARLSPDYDLEDRQAIDAGGEASIAALTPTLMQVDFRSVTDVTFPVVLFIGRHDLTTPPEVSEAWLTRLSAPSKHLEWFENSAHLAPHEEPGHFLLALVQHVRPLAVSATEALD